MDLSDAYDVYDLDNEQPVSRDCLTNCAPGAPAICDAEWCRHECHTLPPHAARALLADIDRAQAMDDRDQAALANLARDIEAESKPDLYELLAERYRQPRRGAA